MRTIAIVGAGYVGVPLAHVFADAGHKALLIDVVAERVEQLNKGDSYIEDVPSDVLKRHVDARLLEATTDYGRLREAEAILIALPTPISSAALSRIVRSGSRWSESGVGSAIRIASASRSLP